MDQDTFDQTLNPPPPPEPQTTDVNTSSLQASLPTTTPTPRKRNSPENDQVHEATPKRYASEGAQKINALFSEFANDHIDEDLDIQYEQYVARRNEFVVRSRNEVIAKMYPAKDPKNLTKDDWKAMSPVINDRFRELLISAFPNNHFQLNELYLRKKKDAEKPP